MHPFLSLEAMILDQVLHLLLDIEQSGLEFVTYLVAVWYVVSVCILVIHLTTSCENKVGVAS